MEWLKFYICLSVYYIITTISFKYFYNKKKYKCLQFFIAIVGCFFICVTTYSHFDILLTRNPNPEKPLPIIILVEVFLGVLILILLISYWYLKVMLILVFYLSIMIFVFEYDNDRSVLNSIIITAATLTVMFLFKKNYEVVYQYL